MHKPFHHLTLFTTALCNLNCNYCYICKDNTNCLKAIDDDLKKDFDNGAYIKSVLDLSPESKNYINHITLWGGEPFLHMERFLDHIDDYFKAFPALKEFDWSTNFTIPNQAKIIQEFINKCEQNYRGEIIEIKCQISIDGYPEMNDLGRGSGVTDKFLKNFHDLCGISYDPTKIRMLVFTKPTLSRTTFSYMDSEEKLKKWFSFFDKELYQVYKEKSSPFDFSLSLWNCAQPTEWTQEDGIKYGSISRLVKNIQNEIFNEYQGWQAYASLVPEVLKASDVLRDIGIYSSLNLKNYYDCGRCGGGCGAFSHSIVAIPNNQFTMCHRGLFDAYVDYANSLETIGSLNNLAKNFSMGINVNDWVYDKDEMLKRHDMFLQMYEHPNKIWYTDLMKMIKLYADTGIIDKKYTSEKNILPTLGYFLNSSSCIQDNYLICGSWSTHSPLEIILLYNGTMEVVNEEVERLAKERGAIGI